MSGTDDGGFQRYGKQSYGTPHTDDPVFTVYTSGSGRFNKAAVEQWFDGVESVVYYTNPEENKLGISLGGSGTDAYTLSHQDTGGAECSIRTVLREYNIDVDDLDSSVALDVEHDPAEGLLVVDLTPVVEEVDA